jgi:hypothetical protein
MVKAQSHSWERGHTRAIAAEQTTWMKEETKWPTKGTVREYSEDAQTLKALAENRYAITQQSLRQRQTG